MPYPVHQLDVAPLIAHITGLKGRVSWLGRDPLGGPGTPWVKLNQARLGYEIGTRFCAEPLSIGKFTCWDLSPSEPQPGREPVLDPLLAHRLPVIVEEPQLSEYFRKVVQANETLIDTGSFED